MSLVADILLLIQQYKYLHIDTAPLLGPFSNVEYKFIFARASYKIVKRANYNTCNQLLSLLD
jgi:hypothetical protein